ncbi:GyrI-like domain-containing protein [Paenibacillus mesophilus]|uniref:GyrI-like domain-containing protein n=1 Tax=Paenibacillus mesophilus TaxID=2582849 RepID=UPI00110F611E|nr:GyrI-like domain-containing protein [Paenibacillus mesophilus]TMV50088.1 GyrI-like domain-containing protein [Paenibacillus mesophilus]
MKTAELGEMKLVGLRVVCPGDRYVFEIPKAIRVLKERLYEIKQTVNPIRLIGAFIPGDYTKEEDGYWACVEVNDYVDIPEGMTMLTVPAQQYAVIRHIGPNTEIRRTYDKLHAWMEENGLQRLLRSWNLEISEQWGHADADQLELHLYDTIKI